MERHNRFENMVALISGAGDGIGRATARIFAKEGASIVCVDINGEALTSLASELEVDGSKLQTIEADVLDSDQVQRVLSVTLERFRKIDILVNIVGGSTIIKRGDARIDQLTSEEWDTIINFNLKGTFLCTQAFVQQMKKQGSGKIINLSSVSGHGVSNFSSSAYAAAKAGIMAFTKKISKELGPYGITCNAVAPGITLSDRIASKWLGLSKESRQDIIATIPLRRVAKPDDQAGVIAFLASKDADYITGVTIDVSGGQF